MKALVDSDGNVLALADDFPNAPAGTSVQTVSVPAAASGPGALFDQHGRCVYTVSGGTVVALGTPRWPAAGTHFRASRRQELRDRIRVAVLDVVALEKWQATPEWVAIEDLSGALTNARNRVATLAGVLAGT